MTEPTFTTPPVAPSRQAPTTFSERADTFVQYIATFAGELTSAVPWFADMKSLTAADRAAVSEALADVLAHRSVVTATSNARIWDASTPYETGDVVWSPLTYQTFRATANVNGGPDPASATVSWERLVDGNLAGSMIIAKSGQTFPGFLECDGSSYDETLYPDLAALGYTELGPVSVIDLGVNGQLILPVTVKWGGVDHTYYVWDKNKNGVSNDEAVSMDALATLLGITTIDEGNRSGTLNGVDVTIPLLGRSYAGDTATPTASADPTVNNTTYTDMLAVWDAFATPAATFGRPAGWDAGYWLTASTDTGSSTYPHAALWMNGAISRTGGSATYYHNLAFEVPNPPQVTNYVLPDSATDLGAPAGYSYYIKY